MIYLDSSATTPVRREAIEAAWPYLTRDFGNPSSHHEVGRPAAQALRAARSSVAEVCGARPGDVTFTSGGTEAANFAIKGLALGSPRGRHLVTSRLEHDAVLASVDYLVRYHGFTADFVEVTPEGLVTADAVRAALRPDTTLVTLAYANNEIGAISDIPAIADVVHQVGALMHTDAVQAAGWLPLTDLGADAVTISGHKVRAPKGIGAAIIRGPVPIEPLIHGGGQEGGRRSGTENVAFAIALATALGLAEDERPLASQRVAWLRDAFVSELARSCPQVVHTGPVAPRLPGHVSCCCIGVSGESVLLDLQESGIIASSGSACAAGSSEPSRVLLALGIDADLARGALRFTLGADCTQEDITATCSALAAALT